MKGVRRSRLQNAVAWGGQWGQRPGSTQDQLSCPAFELILGPKWGLECPGRTPGEKQQESAISSFEDTSHISPRERKMPTPASSRIPPSPLSSGRNGIFLAGYIEAHSRLIRGVLHGVAGSLNVGAPWGSEGLKALFETLADSGSCKMEEGFSGGCNGAPWGRGVTA